MEFNFNLIKENGRCYFGDFNRKNDPGVKSYGFVTGIFARLFGLAERCMDLSGKKITINKKSLFKWAEKHEGVALQTLNRENVEGIVQKANKIVNLDSTKINENEFNQLLFIDGKPLQNDWAVQLLSDKQLFDLKSYITPLIIQHMSESQLTAYESFLKEEHSKLKQDKKAFTITYNSKSDAYYKLLKKIPKLDQIRIEATKAYQSELKKTSQDPAQIELLRAAYEKAKQDYIEANTNLPQLKQEVLEMGNKLSQIIDNLNEVKKIEEEFNLGKNLWMARKDFKKTRS